MQFPLAKKLGFGAGFEPISFVGHNFADTIHSPVDNDVTLGVYSGNGGLSRVYGALSYEFMNNISLGVKVSYMFGDVIHNILSTRILTGGYDFSYQDTIRAYGLLYDLGVQYSLPLGRFESVTIGAVYSPKTRFGAKYMRGEIQQDPSGIGMVTKHEVYRDSVFELPNTFGLGFTYHRLGKMTVGADVLYQQWADAKFKDKANTFNNRIKLNAGGEFIPNYTGNSLFNRVRYRAGLYYANSYLIIKGFKYNEYGVNAGIGIPMYDRRPNQRSFLNLALGYSIIRPESRPLHDEQYFKISLSYTFNERWFFQQRIY
jgi:hypothetical protein